MEKDTFESVRVSKSRLNNINRIYERTKHDIIIEILIILNSKHRIKNIKYKERTIE